MQALRTHRIVPRARIVHRARAAVLLCLALIAGALAAGCGRSADDASSAEGEPLEPQGEAGLHATLPSIVLVGSPVNLRVSPLTDLGTPRESWSGLLELHSSDEAMISPGTFTAGEPGQLVCRGIIFRTPGVHRLTVTSDTGERAVTNPVLVVRTEEELRPRAGEPARHLYWGDAHGHSDVGDGTNPPTTFFYYGRDIAHLDFLCLSEHDFQQFLEVGFDSAESSWAQVADVARQWRRPGFAVLLGWEWSSREHGHRVVLFPDDRFRYVSYREAPTPTALAEALRGTGALSVIAHPAGSKLTPVVNWDTVVPGFDRAIEIYSGHGTQDDDASFRPTTERNEGYSALEAWNHGLEPALVAFSDTHLSTPGNPWPPSLRDAPYRGGLTGVWATGPTEREILEAVADGHCFATSGERLLVQFTIDGHLPGETLTVPAGARPRVRAIVAAPGIVSRVDLMKDGESLQHFAGDGPQMELDFTLEAPEGSARYWLRGRSESGERFWTTPLRVVRQ